VQVGEDDDLDSLVSAENLLPPAAAADGMSSTPSRREIRRLGTRDSCQWCGRVVYTELRTTKTLN